MLDIKQKVAEKFVMSKAQIGEPESQTAKVLFRKNYDQNLEGTISLALVSDIEDFVKECLKGTLELEVINNQLSYLLGDVLTYIDALFSDPEQRKAFKDIMKNLFRRKMSHCQDIAWGSTLQNISKETASLPEED